MSERLFQDTKTGKLVEFISKHDKEFAMVKDAGGNISYLTLDQLVPYDKNTGRLAKVTAPESGKFNFIKQDVQGAEMLVMKGSPEVFKKADYVLNEVNIKKEFFLAPDVVEMNEFMKELGFNRQETIADHPGKNQIDVLYWKD